MTFKHKFLNFEKLELITFADGSKHYTPYPSITTILNKTSDQTQLNKWKERIGEKEANKITNVAKTRGISLDKILEDYLYNKEIDFKKIQPVNLMMFRQLQKILDDHVDVLYGIQSKLYSDKLKVYGKCDLIADFDSKHSLIDFKQTKRQKRQEYIQNFCIQEAFYACCLMEKYHFRCEQIITLIAIEDDLPQQFIFPTIDYIPLTIHTIEKYYKENP